MAEIINLNRAKKAAAKAAAKVQADTNSAKFGQSKSAKATQHKQSDRAKRDLDGHLRE
jgi:hypothetical protein